MKKKESPLVGQAQSISQQERTAGQNNINTGVGDIQGAISNPTASPLYKALYSTEASQLSNAYQNAQANTTARANQAGFGYQSPNAQGANAEMQGREASALGQLPGQVEQTVVPQEIQAGQAVGGLGSQELQAGNQMFTQGAVPLEQQYQNYSLNYTPLWQRALQGGFSALTGGGGSALGGMLGV